MRLPVRDDLNRCLACGEHCYTCLPTEACCCKLEGREVIIGEQVSMTQVLSPERLEGELVGWVRDRRYGTLVAVRLAKTGEVRTFHPSRVESGKPRRKPPVKPERQARTVVRSSLVICRPGFSDWWSLELECGHTMRRPWIKRELLPKRVNRCPKCEGAQIEKTTF